MDVLTVIVRATNIPLRMTEYKGWNLSKIRIEIRKVYTQIHKSLIL
jgi:hypothetical protein